MKKYPRGLLSESETILIFDYIVVFARSFVACLTHDPGFRIEAPPSQFFAAGLDYRACHLRTIKVGPANAAMMIRVIQWWTKYIL